ncbi:MAG: glycoside hydrolase family 97 N-terminal domain-containing protein, partial [Lentilitoribacter sp.]
MSIRMTTLLGSTVLLTACLGATPHSVESAQVESQEAMISKIMESASVSSPDGAIEVRLFTEGGLLKYAVSFAGEDAVSASRLGLRFAEGFGPDANIQIIDIETSEVNESWEQPWGERRVVQDVHEELLVKARRAPDGNAPDIRFNLRVRAFNDGIGFRYEVPKQSSLPATISVMDELTEFNLGQETESWWIPSRMYNRYEYLYQNTPVSAIQKVHTPATFRKPNGTHLSIHEAALINYSGMSLEQEREGVLEASLAPRSDGKKVVTSLPMVTPWRTIQIGDEAIDLINSDIILNLN